MLSSKKNSDPIAIDLCYSHNEVKVVAISID